MGQGQVAELRVDHRARRAKGALAKPPVDNHGGSREHKGARQAAQPPGQAAVGNVAQRAHNSHETVHKQRGRGEDAAQAEGGGQVERQREDRQGYAGALGAGEAQQEDWRQPGRQRDHRLKLGERDEDGSDKEPQPG